MDDLTPSDQIDKIIEKHDGWKGEILRHLRSVIKDAAPDITEEIKWKMPTRPEGLPVWAHNGTVCYVEIWKDNIKLIFLKGFRLADPSKLFNARLKSSTVRAIEIHQGDPIDDAGIKALVAQAVKLNTNK